MSEAVQEILQRIQQLPEEERLLLEEQLVQLGEAGTGRDGSEEQRYPLRGSVVRFERPTDPVAENDWEAMQ